VIAHFMLTEGDAQALKAGPKSPWIESLPEARDEFRRVIDKYDLIILATCRPGSFRTAAEVFKEFVTEGGGLIHIAGRNHARPGGPRRRSPR